MITTNPPIRSHRGNYMFKYLRQRRHFILFAIIFSAFLSLPIFSRLAIDTVFRPLINEQNAGLTANYQKILADLEILAAHPVFPERSYRDNAQFILLKYIPMDGIESQSAKNPRYDAILRMTNEYNDWRDDERVWQSMIHDKELLSIDTSWLKKLDKYDHWNYSSHKEIVSSLSPVRDVSGITRMEIFSQLPQPTYNFLRSWATLHFIKMHKQGHGKEALQIYRHVAFLMHSSGNLVGSMTAYSMLKDEYALLGRFPVKGWDPIPVYYLETYARVTWAWMGILKISYFSEFPYAFFPYLKPQNGLCAGAREAVASFTLYRDFFEPQTYFEANFASNIAYTKKLYIKIKTECNLNIYNKFLDRSPASLDWMSSFTLDESIFKRARNTEYNFSLMDNWIYLPYVRRLVGLMYFSPGSSMNYVRRYESRKKKFSGLNETNF